MHAALLAIKTRLNLSGILSRSGTGSPVQSNTRTIRGSGTLLFDTIAGAAGTPQYSKNGAGLANITEGLTLAMGPTDTLLVSVTATVGQSKTFNVKRNADGSLIEAVTLERIS